MNLQVQQAKRAHKYCQGCNFIKGKGTWSSQISAEPKVRWNLTNSNVFCEGCCIEIKNIAMPERKNEPHLCSRQCSPGPLRSPASSPWRSPGRTACILWEKIVTEKVVSARIKNINKALFLKDWYGWANILFFLLTFFQSGQLLYPCQLMSSILWTAYSFLIKLQRQSL